MRAWRIGKALTSGTVKRKATERSPQGIGSEKGDHPCTLLPNSFCSYLPRDIIGSCFQALPWVLLLNRFIKERARCQTIQRTILQIPAITIRKIYARKLSESSVYAPTAACA